MHWVTKTIAPLGISPTSGCLFLQQLVDELLFVWLHVDAGELPLDVLGSHTDHELECVVLIRVAPESVSLEKPTIGEKRRPGGPIG